MKIRQGNAFTILWTVIVNGGATKLSELENISIELKNPIGQTFYPTFKVNEDEVLEIAISTKYQQWTGMYHLSCVVDKNTDNQTIVDCNDCFELVDKNSRNVQYISVATVGTSQLVLAMNGMSAYEIAQSKGFTGTEEEWLLSIYQPAADAAVAATNVIEKMDAVIDKLGGIIDCEADVNDLKDRVTTLESIDHTQFMLKGEVPNMDGYAKVEDIPAPYDDTAVKSRLTTLESIDHSQYLTEHQSLDGYVTSDKLDEYALKSEVPSLDGYAKTEDIPTDYVTEQTLDLYVQLYQFATLEGKVNNLTAIDHNKYALKSDIPTNYITEDDLGKYVTEDKLAETLQAYVKYDADKNYLYINTQ